LKKITAILLVSLLIFDSCGYFFIYTELSNFFKKEAAEKINDFLPDNELEIISAHITEINSFNPNFVFVNDNEIKVNESMYDIYKTEFKNDSVFYYCINDKNENILEKAFSNYLESKTNNKPGNIPIHNILLNIIKIALAPVNFNNNYIQFSINFTTIIPNILPQYSIDIPSPPPKSFS
jgi:hypothetical protein